MRFRLPSALSVSLPFPFVRFTDRRGPVEGATWVERSVFRVLAPCEAVIGEMNFNEERADLHTICGFDPASQSPGAYGCWYCHTIVKGK